MQEEKKKMSYKEAIEFLMNMLASTTIIIYLSRKYKIPVDDVMKEIDGKSTSEIKAYFERLATEYSKSD